MPCLVKSRGQVGGKGQPLHPGEADAALPWGAGLVSAGSRVRRIKKA